LRDGAPAAEGLLERATRLAARVAVAGTAALARSPRASGPALDAERFRFEMAFFVEHYLGGLLGLSEIAGTIRVELERLADLAAAGPHRVLCHRDFHSRNLMVRADGELAMVDIQDARWGPDSYDLASLLFDAYIDLDAAMRERLLGAYLAALPASPDEEPFRHRLAIVAAQRMLKALGTFGYQITTRGREVYRPAIDRTVTRLETLLPRLDALPRLGELLPTLRS